MPVPVLEGGLIRRYVITNTTDQILFVNMHLFPKVQNPKNWVRIPSVISAVVKPHSSSQIFACQRIFAEQEWEELNYELNIQYAENKQIQQYGGGYDRGYKDDDYDPNRNIPNAPRLNIKLESADADREHNYSRSQEYYGPGYSTMKSCVSCSTLNDVNNPVCRVCNKNLI